MDYLGADALELAWGLQEVAAWAEVPARLGPDGEAVCRLDGAEGLLELLLQRLDLPSRIEVDGVVWALGAP